MNIGTFILRRILLAVPVLIGITLITFTISWEANGGDMARSYITPKMTPSQAAEVRLAHGFDQPFYVQYLTYVEGLLHGDLGISHTANDITVWQAFLVYFPATLELTLVAMIFAIVIGIFVGTLSAVHNDQPVDHATRFIALSGVSVPIFWL
jgi:ABC-type dipeptide/oligopeptide/nickel transport system permease component